MTITNQPTGKKTKKAASSTAPNRLPSVRERRPALAALAVLLIAGGAVLAGWLALRQSQTESYVMITEKVLDGDQLEEGQYAQVELPREGVPFVPFDDLENYADGYAQADLLPGTVLVEGMLDDRPDLALDERRVGLDLAPGQYPPGLDDGDTVTVLLRADSGEVTTQTSGRVSELEEADTGSGAVVEVVISATCSAEYAGFGDGNVVLETRSPRAEAVTCVK